VLASFATIVMALIKGASLANVRYRTRRFAVEPRFFHKHQLLRNAIVFLARREVLAVTLEALRMPSTRQHIANHLHDFGASSAKWVDLLGQRPRNQVRDATPGARSATKNMRTVESLLSCERKELEKKLWLDLAVYRVVAEGLLQ
jgi:hypothetical protein